MQVRLKSIVYRRSAAYCVYLAICVDIVRRYRAAAVVFRAGADLILIQIANIAVVCLSYSYRSSSNESQRIALPYNYNPSGISASAWVISQ